MSNLGRMLRVFMFVAASMLVVNDVARLVLPSIQQSVVEQICDPGGKDENPADPFSFFEEEIKHHNAKHHNSLLLPVVELDAATAHLIKDDDVRHLAFIPIFSPPPNWA